MRKFLAVIAILFPLAAPVVQADSNTSSANGSQTPSNGAAIIKGVEVKPFLPAVNLPKNRPFPIAAATNGDSIDKDVKKPESAPANDLDLRYVDWDKVKAGKIAKSGDDEEANGDGDKEDGEKKDEGDGGFDSLWDAPKLG